MGPCGLGWRNVTLELRTGQRAGKAVRPPVVGEGGRAQTFRSAPLGAIGAGSQAIFARPYPAECHGKP